MESNSSGDQQFLQLPFDQYQRYYVVRAVASLVRTRLGRALAVLDVGGLAYSLNGAGPMLPIRLSLPSDRTVTLDSQDGELEGYVRGVGEHLPFPDNGFDLVVSCDTLEHVHPECRKAFVDELLRVSANYVVLIAPCASHLTNLAERILDQYITHSLGVVHVHLREHIALGLPEHETIQRLLLDQRLRFIDFESGYLYSWLVMMLARHYVLSVPKSSQLVTMLDEFYNIAFSGQDHNRPGYRHVYVISKLGNDELLEEVRAQFDLTPSTSQGHAYGTGAEIFQMAMALVNLRRGEGTDKKSWIWVTSSGIFAALRRMQEGLRSRRSG